MIVDAHVHAGPGDGLTGPWDTRARLGPHWRRAARAGISRLVIFPPFRSDSAAANRTIASYVRRWPRRLVGFASVQGRRDRGRVAELVREAVQDLGLLGLKVHRHQSRITREICEAARRWSLPLLYDVAGEASVLELLAREYPDVPFIVPHLGSFADDWRAQLAVLDHLARHPNVYADTSGVRRFDLLVEAVRRGVARKLIFGSDGPWLHPGVELAKIQALSLPPATFRAVTGGNILGLIRRGIRRRQRLVLRRPRRGRARGTATSIPGSRLLRALARRTMSRVL